MSSLILKSCPRAVVMTRAVEKDQKGLKGLKAPKAPKAPKALKARKDRKDRKVQGGRVAAKADDTVSRVSGCRACEYVGPAFWRILFLVMIGPAAILTE